MAKKFFILFLISMGPTKNEYKTFATFHIFSIEKNHQIY
jgi:hypothetical protein